MIEECSSDNRLDSNYEIVNLTNKNMSIVLPFSHSLGTEISLIRTTGQEIENHRCSGFKTQRGEYAEGCCFHCSSIFTTGSEQSSNYVQYTMKKPHNHTCD